MVAILSGPQYFNGPAQGQSHASIGLILGQNFIHILGCLNKTVNIWWWYLQIYFFKIIVL